MRAVVQRVSSASVRVDGEVVGALERPGLVVLLGVTHTDSADDAAALAAKTWNLRILRDERSASDVDAPLLVISQFTLYADVRKGRRPSWGDAAPGPVSEPLYDEYCRALRELGAHVERGAFGADMAVSLVNDGPVTLVLDSAELRRGDARRLGS
ncbi:D-aminoacyl-tRNA deacylase [Mumia sp. DW29H23]|uniref:D-aminoacyl-tRNA deacylase n=1 Tax=Mumia sp. DW29H23 TaxID=3421241 RepID=UPI003D69E732